MVERGDRIVAIECKASTSPRLERGFWQAKRDLDIREAYVVAPIFDSYPIEEGVLVAGVEACIRKIRGSGG